MLECYRTKVFVIAKDRKSYFDFLRKVSYAESEITDYKYVYLENAKQLKFAEGGLFSEPIVKFYGEFQDRPDWNEIRDKMKGVKALST